MSGNLTPPIPIIGQPNSAEDPIVKEAIEYLRNGLNAILNSENKVDPTLFPGGALTSQYFKPTVGMTTQTTTASMTTGEADITGTEKAIQVPVESYLLTWYTFDISNGATSGKNTCVGNFKLDNVIAGPSVVHEISTNGRLTLSEFAFLTLAPGEHKIKLSQIYSSSGSVSIVPTTLSGSTRLMYMLVAK
jgi:hypothetical protein